MTTEIKGAEFLARAQGWFDWVRSYAERQDRMIEIARSKPPGYDHDSNLILDSEGEVWKNVWTTRAYVRLTRSNLHEPYRMTEDLIPEDNRAYNGGPRPFEIGGRTFVAKGWDRPEADWCWVPPNESGRGTLGYYEASRRSTEAGMRLGEALRALSPEAIDEWAKEWAEVAPHDGQSRTSYHVDGDWESFSARFNLPSKSNVPDIGGVLCTLHILVDHAAGLTDTMYAY